MDPVVCAAAGRDRFVTFDAKGAGLSTRGISDDISWEDYVSDVALVLEHLKITRAILVSHVSAGMSRSATLVAHPERVCALILISVTVTINAWNLPLWIGVADENWDLFLRSLITRSVPPGPIDERLARMRELEAPSDYLRAMQLAARSPTIEHLLPMVQAPTLVVHPKDYLMIPVGEATKLAAGIPNARLITIQAHQMSSSATQTNWRPSSRTSLERPRAKWPASTRTLAHRSAKPRVLRA